MSNMNPYGVTTDQTYGQMIIEPSIEQQKAQAELRQIEMEIAMRQAEMEIMMQKAAVASLPFEETEEFRDYIVWLCGFTDREDPPNAAEWAKLKEKTGQVAAKFALKARDDARRNLRNSAKSAYGNSTTTTSTSASTTQLASAIGERIDLAAISAMSAGTNLTYTTTETS